MVHSEQEHDMFDYRVKGVWFLYSAATTIST